MLHLFGASISVIGAQHLSLLIAPGIAGGTIWYFTRQGDALGGMAIAFMLDGLTFLLSVTLLSALRLDKIANRQGGSSGFFDSLKQGFDYIRADKSLFGFTLFASIFGLLGYGPYLALLPIYAKTNFADGALSLGLLMSANGAGALVGIILGSVMKPGKDWLGLLSQHTLCYRYLMFFQLCYDNPRKFVQ